MRNAFERNQSAGHRPHWYHAAQLAALTAAIHANGILGSAQPNQETAEDILASIINPPAKEVK